MDGSALHERHTRLQFREGDNHSVARVEVRRSGGTRCRREFPDRHAVAVTQLLVCGLWKLPLKCVSFVFDQVIVELDAEARPIETRKLFRGCIRSEVDSAGGHARSAIGRLPRVLAMRALHCQRTHSPLHDNLEPHQSDSAASRAKGLLRHIPGCAYDGPPVRNRGTHYALIKMCGGIVNIRQTVVARRSPRRACSGCIRWRSALNVY